MMTFDKYQAAARITAQYPTLGHPMVYPALGLNGEAGEVAEKVKKLFRDRESVITDDFRESIKLELGDVLWYVANLAAELNLSLEEIARSNLEKLTSRMKRNAICGDGDRR